MKKYKFRNKLIEGVIKSRPNRFLMNVKMGRKIILCHCPSTGSIGGIVFSNTPCLLSKAEGDKRKTPYTVEAISLDKISKKNKKWIGINQVKINKYVNFFLKNKKLSKMIYGKEILREKKLGNSRIDFLIEDTYLEVKMPLMRLPTNDEEQVLRHSKFNSFDRLIKHFTDLSEHLRKNKRAIILLAYIYDAKPFSPPKRDKSNSKIIRAARKASRYGIETWQANFKIDKSGVSLTKYFQRNLF